MDETKICPFCGETINSQAQKCKYCGEWLDNKAISKNSIFSKNFIKIILTTLIFLFIVSMLVLGYKLYQNRYQIDEISYKNITYIGSNVDNLTIGLSPMQLMAEIKKQENDLKEYLTGNHSIKEKTGVFRLYYKNLNLLTNILNSDAHWYPELCVEDTSKESNSVLINILKRHGINVTPEYDSYAQESIADYFNMVNPQIDTLKLIYFEGGCYGFNINDNNIAENYAKYLNKSWQDYLNNKKQMYDILEHQNYFCGNAPIPDTSIKFAKGYIIWSDFLKKYPKFELKEEIQDKMNLYGENILYKGTYAFERSEYNKDGKLRQDIRDGCEYFLKHANKNTDIYKQIQKDYEILKNNNFEYNEDTNNI